MTYLLASENQGSVKRCMGCGADKPLDQYYRQGERHRSRCKSCYAEHNRQQRVKHMEKRRAYDAERGTGWTPEERSKYEPTEEEKFFTYALRTYGLTRDRYEAMLLAQGGVCAICRQECNRGNSQRLCIDHHHGTGQVRGLICFKCNTGLGRFDEDLIRMQAAIAYLRRAADARSGLPSVFVCGPMSGLPQLNYPAFNKAARYFRSLGHRVENPAENTPPACGTWQGWMRLSIAQLTTVDQVVLLPGWRRSKGARVEFRAAHGMGLRITSLAQAMTNEVSDA